MKTYTFSVLILLLAATVSCKKYKENRDDAGGDLYIRGRAFVVDSSVFPAVTSVPAGTIIKIGYKEDYTNNFIYQVTTDPQGYFLFQNLKQGKAYSIFGELNKNDAAYITRDDKTLEQSLDSLPIYFRVSSKGQNGIIYKVTDANGGAVFNCKICIYSVTGGDESCTGSTDNINTNAFGYARKFNLPAGNIYNFYKVTIGSTILRARDTILLPNNAIVQKTIIVQ